MESMPPAPAAAAGSGSGISVTTTSDVRKVLATDAAFSKAHRTTFVGSMIPAFNKSSYLPAPGASKVTCDIQETYNSHNSVTPVHELEESMRHLTSGTVQLKLQPKTVVAEKSWSLTTPMWAYLWRR